MSKFFQQSLATKLSLGLTCLSLCFGVSTVFSAAMSSGSYNISSDSLNIGGLDSATSTNYGLRDTIGGIATGLSSSSNYVLSSGYRGMEGSYITISNANNFSLPNISGMTGGTASASSSWYVLTDSLSGYQLTIEATSSPALRDSLHNTSFSDYTPAGSNPDYDFILPSASSLFGYSPTGPDIAPRFKNDGSACNTGTNITVDKCWSGLSTTTAIIATKNSANFPTGATTTVSFQTGIGSSQLQTAGTYQATIIVTALAL